MSRYFRWFSLSMLSTTALLGCVPDFDEDLSRLTEPRLLALRTTPAEAKVGAETEIEALIAVPEGQATPDLEFGLCLARKPLTQLGPVNEECLALNPPQTVLVPLGKGASTTLTVPEEACRLFGPLQPPPEGGKPSGRAVDPDITGGFYQPFVARLGDEPSVGAVRLDCDLGGVGRDQAVRYRQQYRRNENPRLSRVAPVGGDALDDAVTTQVRVGSRLTLSAEWEACPSSSRCGDGFCTADEDASSCAEDCTTPHGCGGAERYVWYDAAKREVTPRREGITVAWFASRGHFDEEQTGASEAEAASASGTQNTWVLGSQPGPATLWLVIRDTRGGQSWQTFHFEVTP
jgi:hypothetical protein